MSDFNIDMPVQQGWQCPICKRVYSPFTPMCYYCSGESVTTTTTDKKLDTTDPCPPYGSTGDSISLDEYFNKYTTASTISPKLIINGGTQFEDDKNNM